MSFSFGVATCQTCNKWHPAVVDEHDGVARLAFEGHCQHCEVDGVLFRLDRLGACDTVEDAAASMTAWLAEHLPRDRWVAPHRPC